MEERINNMSSGQDFLQIIRDGLDINAVNPLDYSSLTLAYIGDDAYDLVIRTYLLSYGNMPVNKLNRMADELVKAGTQSAMMAVLEPVLTEDEAGVYRRGRNAKSHTKAKNASVAEYRRATGFEALMGYLYLNRRYERMVELIKAGMENYRTISDIRKNQDEQQKGQDSNEI